MLNAAKKQKKMNIEENSTPILDMYSQECVSLCVFSFVISRKNKYILSFTLRKHLLE